MILGYSAWLLSLHVEGFKDPIWKAWLGWRCVKGEKSSITSGTFAGRSYPDNTKQSGSSHLSPSGPACLASPLVS